jgi:hypothetical protein
MIIDYAKDYINLLVRKQQLPDIEITSFSRRVQNFRPTVTTLPNRYHEGVGLRLAHSAIKAIHSLQSLFLFGP